MDLEPCDPVLSDDEDEELIYMKTTYHKMEEHVMDVHMKIKDFLYKEGEHELLYFLGFDETAILLYDKTYVNELKKTNPLTISRTGNDYLNSGVLFINPLKWEKEKIDIWIVE